MTYSIKRISWAAALAIAACMCTSDAITDKEQGIWDQAAHNVSVSADTDSGNDAVDEDENK